ncbi:MAG: hypothetical protein NXH85_12360 [Pseudomonadaceae bacterium]|nr:hypothetical protein [Pseudomonadaceae bacterium]
MNHFPPSRDVALARLADFLPNAGSKYARDRNVDAPANDRPNVSMLSPYLRHRAISEREVLQSVLARFSPSTCEKFVQEVFWRAYFKGWLEHRPYVWHAYNRDVQELSAELTANEELKARVQAATSGSTGIDVFDSWAQELLDYGYLHNHARMWFASIWVFTLRLPWQLGADWFLQHLLDGDPASNTCSWRWVAGLHTKGKTYCARPDNIRRYAPRFFQGDEPAGLERLATQAEPISENPDLLSEPRAQPHWPQAPADIDRSRCALLLHGDDLGSGAIERYATVGALSPSPLSPHGESTQVRRFRRALTQDALDSVNPQQAHSRIVQDGETITGWLRETGVSEIVIPYSPVGPTAARISSLTEDLAAEGIEVIIDTRHYDRLAWPYAKAGFFKLGKKIPELLDALSMSRSNG